jgi:hypothetical protein
MRIFMPYAYVINHTTKQFFRLNRYYKRLGNKNRSKFQDYPKMHPEESINLYNDGTLPYSGNHRLYCDYIRKMEELDEQLRDYTELHDFGSDH